MRLVASAVLALVACQGGGDDSFPVVPGGGEDTVFNPMVDAPAPDGSGDGGTSISGRVCIVTDLRNLTSCATGDSSGITVTLGTSSALTAVDGTFTISAPPGPGPVWSASAVGFVSTVMPLTTTHLLPIVSTARYGELLLDNGVVLQAGDGSVFARMIRNGAPAAGVTTTVAPPPVYGPLYDGASSIVWDLDATAAGGVVWVPDVATATATLTLSAPGGAVPVVQTLPVEAGAITFATVVVP